VPDPLWLLQRISESGIEATQADLAESDDPQVELIAARLARTYLASTRELLANTLAYELADLAEVDVLLCHSGFVALVPIRPAFAPSPKLLRTINASASWSHACAFSPDGDRLVSGGFGETLRVWDASTGDQLLRIAEAGDVSACSFSPDGALVISSHYCSVDVWDANSGTRIGTIETGSDRVFSCSFSPDGSRIVTAGDDSVQTWNVSTGECLTKFVGHTEPVQSATFSPDGALLATSGRDETIRLWDAASGNEVCAIAHPDDLQCCRFSPDGTQIVSATEAGEIRVWDTATGQLIRTFGGDGGQDGGQCAFSPDGTRIVASASEGTLWVWDASTGEATHRLDGHADVVTSCVFSPDGTRIVSSSADGTIRVWDAGDSAPWIADHVVADNPWEDDDVPVVLHNFPLVGSMGSVTTVSFANRQAARRFGVGCRSFIERSDSAFASSPCARLRVLV
jgi:WD40 repeat protein